jgi:hypothetical protein
MSFGSGFTAAGQAGAALDSIRWGTDYLMKVHKPLPDGNSSLLVTRVSPVACKTAIWRGAKGTQHCFEPMWKLQHYGTHVPTTTHHRHTHTDPAPLPPLSPPQVGDIDTEMLLWYRPEEQSLPRPAFTVDLTTGGSDLGGSVAAALASASLLFRNQNESEYATQLLTKAQEVGEGCARCKLRGKLQTAAPGAQPRAATLRPQNASEMLAPLPPLQVYEFARAVKGRFGDGDFNLTLLYNSSTLYDDLAWAAGWLYKATKQVGPGLRGDGGGGGVLEEATPGRERGMPSMRGFLAASPTP